MDTIYFKAGLSNGETAIEGKGKFSQVDGELSPINKLFEYVKDEGVSITSVSICTPEGQEFHAPSSAKNPKFHAFSEGEKPSEYKIYRKAGGDVIGPNTKFEHFTVVESLFGNVSLQLWVSHTKPYQSYTIVKAA